ncbi:hypothetical protein GCM10008995_10530 [Halobellus salinus]|uniref:Uncharacterized protein n=1 Tax=Halobellus salinus TaxID=931585 RepID=A0A830ENS1_9EURY|nr:hypothetical protein [Halobellus salinus]GGJ02660.1 hypothetical protein GCM10008995_10530 [Halobellus salinus]SMP16770.1 hypothetical protein SAMN06265347_10622 [Halobellus salinus]
MSDRVARPAVVALITVVLLAGVGATGAPVSAQPADRIAGTQVDPDDVSLGVDLRTDGSAAWTVEYRVRLDDDNTTRAFESLRDDIEANDTRYVSEFRGRMVATADTAENATGREMEIRNVSVTASRQELPQEYGVLSYTFAWTNFSVIDERSITAGDALTGFFLDSETSMQFSWPPGYAVETAQPDPDEIRSASRIAVWNGQVDFGPNEPTLIVTERAAGGTTTTAPGDGVADGSGGGGSAGDGSGGADGNSDGGLLLGAIAVIGVALAAAGIVYWRRRHDSAVDASGSPAGVETGLSQSAGDGAAAGAPGSSDLETDGRDGSEAASTGGDGAAADATDNGAGGGTAGAGAGRGTAAGPPADGSNDDPPWADELLSNREQVLALVEHGGGRMKQQEVAQTLDWTDAKTSQVVRKMREEGDLDAFRLGRENVLVLPDEEFRPSDGDA